MADEIFEVLHTLALVKIKNHFISTYLEYWHHERLCCCSLGNEKDEWKVRGIDAKKKKKVYLETKSGRLIIKSKK